MLISQKELLKALRDNATSWEDIGKKGGRFTTTSLVLSEVIINQVKSSFVSKEFRGRAIYSYTDGETSYRVWVS